MKLRSGTRTLMPIARMSLTFLMMISLMGVAIQSPNTASQIDIIGPTGSGSFGKSVTVLPNGNLVITDPEYDLFAAIDAGAVYLYNGKTGALISGIYGSHNDDNIGSGGVTVLSNGNYVVLSPLWDRSTNLDAGAVTWGDGTSGASGLVTSSSSLVGSSPNDRVGSGGVIELSNGNYVVLSPHWNNGANTEAGAVTWGNGASGVKGEISSSNSLVGSKTNDQVGADQTSSDGVTKLDNGNYVVCSPLWDKGTVTDAGAATWGDGTTGVSGEISSSTSLVGVLPGDEVCSHGVTELSNGSYIISSPDWNAGLSYNAGAVTWGSGTSGVKGLVTQSNSLVGSLLDDQVGYGGITDLSNGNYVVSSPYWNSSSDTDAGAVTWGSGTAGIKGLVTQSNSLVGSSYQDYVGSYGVTALSNGNYVVSSPSWDSVTATDAGAVTWGNGATGISGEITLSKSLIGSTNNQIGSGGVTALGNGNYVVRSPAWDSSTDTNAGAVTWGNGAIGKTGLVSQSNSLVGGTTNDSVGSHGVTKLGNGNYVVRSPDWDSSTKTNAGAVTWGSGTSGVAGEVTSSNSLVGGSDNDQVGLDGITVLSNSNYVVRSLNWDNVSTANAGAVTWGSGTAGVKGLVDLNNSLVGNSTSDQVGNGGVRALSNGNYVVTSYLWNNGTDVDAGAITWGNGATGVTGLVDITNSLVGSSIQDWIGDVGVTALSNGNYVVSSQYWDSAPSTNVGAVTWGNGTTGRTGEIFSSNSLVGGLTNDRVGSESVRSIGIAGYVATSPDWALTNVGAITWGHGMGSTTGLVTSINSVIGGSPNNGHTMFWIFDAVNYQLVVGRPAENIVTLFRPYSVQYLPLVMK